MAFAAEEPAKDKNLIQKTGESLKKVGDKAVDLVTTSEQEKKKDAQADAAKKTADPDDPSFSRSFFWLAFFGKSGPAMRFDIDSMLPIIVFILVLIGFCGIVWYSVTDEDIPAGSDKPRFGALSRALQRARKRRSSRGWGVFDRRIDPQKAHSTGASSSAQASTEEPLPPGV